MGCLRMGVTHPQAGVVRPFGMVRKVKLEDVAGHSSIIVRDYTRFPFSEDASRLIVMR